MFSVHITILSSYILISSFILFSLNTPYNTVTGHDCATENQTNNNTYSDNENDNDVVLDGQTSSKKSADRVKLQLYYSAYDEKTQQAVQDSIAPLLKSKLHPHFHIEYIPYGKTQSSCTKDQKLKIVCTGGPDDCEANQQQACVLKKYPEKTAIDFISCQMNSSEPLSNTQQCCETLKMDPDFVEKCGKSKLGRQLLDGHGKVTQNLIPRLLSVPWFVFNGVWHERNQKNAEKNVAQVVCDILGEKHCRNLKDFLPL